MAQELIEGWTYPIEYELSVGGAPVDLTACTVTLVLLDRDGHLSTSTGDITVYDSTGGLVRFTPGSCTDLLHSGSPYAVRFRVVDGVKISFIPNSKDPERWVVSL